MALHFDNARYIRRQLVENKFSILKRKFGGVLKARVFVIQRKEIANKMVVFNLHRFLQFLLGEVFYRALIQNPSMKWIFTHFIRQIEVIFSVNSHSQRFIVNLGYRDSGHPKHYGTNVSKLLFYQGNL